jgi:hypothetical protein
MSAVTQPIFAANRKKRGVYFSGIHPVKVHQFAKFRFSLRFVLKSMQTTAVTFVASACGLCIVQEHETLQRDPLWGCR